MLLFWSVILSVKETIFSFLSFLYCGVFGSKCVKSSEPDTQYVNKVLLGLPSSRLSELSSSFKLKIISVIFANLFILTIRGSLSKSVSMIFFLQAHLILCLYKSYSIPVFRHLPSISI